MRRLRDMLGRDNHLGEVILKGITSIIFKASGAILAFLFNYLLVRRFGAEDTGVFYTMFSILNVVAVLGRLGTDNILVRRISVQLEKRNRPGLVHVYQKGLRLLGLSLSVLAVLLVVFSSPIAEYVFGKPYLQIPICITAATLLPFALITFYTEVLKGTRNIRYASLLKGFGVYFLGCILLLLPEAWYILPYSFLWVFFAAAAGTFLTGVLLWHINLRRYSFSGGKPGTLRSLELMRESRPLLVASFIQIGGEYFAILILGIYAADEVVGVFGILLRFGLIIVFCLDAMNAILAPKFAQLFILGETRSMEDIGRRVVSATALVTLPLLGAILVFAEELLALFGPEFTAGATGLRILVCAQYVNLLTGPVGYLLIMSHQERAFAVANGISLGILLVLSFILIPAYGLLGAVAAFGTMVIAKNLMFTILVRNLLKMHIFPFLKKY